MRYSARLWSYKTITLSFFIGLLVATAYAQAPSPVDYLQLYAVPSVMIAIAQAESGAQQFDAKGNLLCDGVYHTHCGIFQIGLEHDKQAKSMGWDIRTPAGNISEALWLFSKNGTHDWYASYNDSTNPNSWGKFFYKDGTPRGGASPPK